MTASLNVSRGNETSLEFEAVYNREISLPQGGIEIDDLTFVLNPTAQHND